MIVVLLLVVAANWLSYPPAGAHGELQETRPPQGATRDQPPRHIRITFTEAPTEDSVVKVTDGCGRDVVREQYLEDRTKHVFIRAGRAVPGEWTVSYRVLSAEDGHQTRGSYGLTVTGETDCSEPQAAPDPEPDDAGETGEDDPQVAPGSPTGDGADGFPIVPALIGAGILIGLATLVRISATKR